MWQLDKAATSASSGSTPAGFDHGAGTTAGEEDAGTVKPPSNVQVCSREYLPLRKSASPRAQEIIALCSDMENCALQGGGGQAARGEDLSRPEGSLEFNLLQLRALPMKNEFEARHNESCGKRLAKARD